MIMMGFRDSKKCSRARSRVRGRDAAIALCKALFQIILFSNSNFINRLCFYSFNRFQPLMGLCQKKVKRTFFEIVALG